MAIATVAPVMPADTTLSPDEALALANYKQSLKLRGLTRLDAATADALATAAVHHKLIRQGLRMQTGLVIETGEAREVHHFCVLAGYGAEAVNPYLAFETLEQIRERTGLKLKPYEIGRAHV